MNTWDKRRKPDGKPPEPDSMKPVPVPPEPKRTPLIFLKIYLKFQQTWDFLNGKKLIIGLLIAGLSYIPTLGPFGVWVRAVGYAIAGVGGMHGIQKIKKGTGERETWEKLVRTIIDLIVKLLERKRGK